MTDGHCDRRAKGGGGRGRTDLGERERHFQKSPESAKRAYVCIAFTSAGEHGSCLPASPPVPAAELPWAREEEEIWKQCRRD